VAWNGTCGDCGYFPEECECGNFEGVTEEDASNMLSQEVRLINEYHRSKED